MQKPYTQKAQKALDLAVKMSKSMHHNYVGTEHILVGLLKEGTGAAAKVLNSMEVEEEKLIELIQDLIAPSSSVSVMDADGYSPRTRKILESADVEAERFKSKEIGTEHLLISILKEPDCAGARLLNTLGVNPQKLYMELLNSMGEEGSAYKDEFQNGKFNKKKNGESTTALDQYSRDLTKLAREGKLDPVIGRTQEIQRVIQILSRRGKNNPCLIGEPGVGKTAIAEEIGRAHV